MARGITSTPLLSAAACASVFDRVLALRAHWTARQGDWMYTLGAASYLDQGAAYGRLVERTNPLLQHHFADLYAQLAAWVGALKGAPVGYAPHLARPGFHLFVCRPEIAGQRGAAHFDRPHEHHSWSGAVTDPFAITVPIRLPAQGGGLNYWIGAEPHYLAYEPGTAYTIGIDTRHQIANEVELAEGDFRVTFQAHAVRQATGDYVLFF